MQYTMDINFGKGRERKWRASTKDSRVTVVNMEGLFCAAILKLQDEIIDCASNYP